MTQSRRRQLIVDRPRQTALVKAIVVPAATCLIGGFLAASWFLDGVLDGVGEDVRRAHWITWTLAGALFVAAAVAFLLYHALHLSHRIVGPCYRIRQDLRRAMSGHPSLRIVLRRGDWLDDVAHEANRLLDWAEASRGDGPECADEPPVERSIDQRSPAAR